MTGRRHLPARAAEPRGASPLPRRLGALAVAFCLLVAGAPPVALAQAGATTSENEAPAESPPDAGVPPEDAPQRTSSPYVPPPAPLFAPAPPGWPAPTTPPGTAYALVDAATGQLLAARGEDEPRAVASTVKVLTALTVIARAELDEEVTVGDEVLDVPGSGVDLEPGDTWTIAELLDAVISRSGNEAAEALAVHVGGDLEGFLELMRADAAALGLGDVPLVSPSGLDDGNQLSALDLATLARVALAHEDLRPFFGRREVVLPSVGAVETRNQLLLLEPEATGVKTGFTLAAGNSLIGSVERDGRELIAVVLDAGEDPARFEGAADLLDLGFEAFEPSLIRGAITYTVAGGEVAYELPSAAVVTPTELPPLPAFEITDRPPDGDLEVDITVDDEVLASVLAGRDDTAAPAPVAGGAAIGRAAVDGAYAALRAAVAADVLR